MLRVSIAPIIRGMGNSVWKSLRMTPESGRRDKCKTIDQLQAAMKSGPDFSEKDLKMKNTQTLAPTMKRKAVKGDVNRDRENQAPTSPKAAEKMARVRGH